MVGRGGGGAGCGEKRGGVEWGGCWGIGAVRLACSSFVRYNRDGTQCMTSNSVYSYSFWPLCCVPIVFKHDCVIKSFSIVYQ